MKKTKPKNAEERRVAAAEKTLQLKGVLAAAWLLATSNAAEAISDREREGLLSCAHGLAQDLDDLVAVS